MRFHESGFLVMRKGWEVGIRKKKPSCVDKNQIRGEWERFMEEVGGESVIGE